MNLTRRRVSWKLRALSALIALPLVLSACTYMKIDPAPDVDKPMPIVNDNSCWMAAAANMLAGAGYGAGATVQARADDIYGDMVAQYGVANGGWTDTALNWWLSSANNTWPGNPYTVVTVYGNKSPKNPWANPNGARFIGNELRRCQFVGLSISWPTVGASVGSGGHAIACWGDHSGSGTLSGNPGRVRVTDSDRDSGGDVQSYRYDTYNNPNPGGPNEGNGWYFDYHDNHPYIKHIITLCSTDDPSDGVLTQKVVGSYRIHQQQPTAATDLHYEVGTDVNILSYKTTVSWPADGSPDVTESQPQRRQLDVDWDFTERPVPQCTWVTITTEFIVPQWNAIWYRDVRFTYPDGRLGAEFVPIEWRMTTPEVEGAASIRDVTGGHVVGAFDLVSDDPAAERPAGEYRFIHEYSFNQDPERHTIELQGRSGFQVANLRFGHSYGYMDTEQLWRFSDWMTEDPSTYAFADEPVAIELDWEGRLPYPEGEDVFQAIPEIPRDGRPTPNTVD